MLVLLLVLWLVLVLLLLLLLWSRFQSKDALANAKRDLSGSWERMPKSTSSFPKCYCLLMMFAGYFN